MAETLPLARRRLGECGRANYTYNPAHSGGHHAPYSGCRDGRAVAARHRSSTRAGPGVEPRGRAAAAGQTDRLSQSIQRRVSRSLRLWWRKPGPHRHVDRDKRRRDDHGCRRAVRERRRERDQRQSERQLGVCGGSRLRLHPQRQQLDATGVRQGIQSRTQRPFRIVGGAESRRQHHGRGRALGIERRNRHQRQSE